MIKLLTKKGQKKIHDDLSTIYKAVRHLERPDDQEDYINTLNDIHVYIKRLQREFYDGM